jgi:pSer/pThr/pTyr-binding forkhead associated (FHA) protein
MPRTATLIIQHGDERREVRLTQPITTIGRAPDNQIVLNDAQVSRYHARVELADDAILVTDLGSDNQTRVRDVAIEAQKAYPLKDGDVLRIGNYALVLRVSALVDEGTALTPGAAETLTPQTATLTVAAPRLMVSTAEGTKEVWLDRATLTLGRDPTNDIVVEDRVISRRHAELRRTPGGYEIVDLASANGITYQGVRVPQKLLADGDVLWIAKAVSLTYKTADAKSGLAAWLDRFAKNLAPLLGSPSNARTLGRQGALATLLGILGIIFATLKVVAQFFELITHPLSPVLIALPYIILLLFVAAGIFSLYTLSRSTWLVNRRRATIVLAFIVIGFTIALVAVAVVIDLLTRLWLVPIVSPRAP